MSKKCTYKRKFKTRASAESFAQGYMQRIALTFYPMIAYYCNKHNCYHVGHDKYSERVDKNLEVDVE